MSRPMAGWRRVIAPRAPGDDVVPLPARLYALLRDGAWLDRRRMRAYGLILLAINAGAMLVVGARALGLFLPLEGFATLDFDSFYAAGRLTLNGTPALAYDMAAHKAAEHAIYGRADLGYNFFFYPPVLLLLCPLLALLPFGWAFVAWGCGQALLFAAALRAVLGRAATLLPCLAFPSAVLSLAMGQNALLTAGLFAGGTALLGRNRPFAAGLVLGCLCYKPHFGLLLPVALLAGRQWRAIAGAATSVAALGAAVTLLFGPDIWTAYWRLFTTTGPATFANGPVPPGHLVSVFGAALQAGAPPAVANGLQAAAALGAAALVARLWRGPAPLAPRAIALVAGTMLSVPVILYYDLTAAAVCLAWLAVDARRTGWLAWEKAFVVLAFAIALFARGAGAHHLPLGPLVALGFLAVAWRRSRYELEKGDAYDVEIVDYH